jgi:hypothetical protein
VLSGFLEVPTREGLRPIEEIKVGDYVLSSPEDGSGKPEYKPVVNTFIFRNRTIKEIYYLENANDDRSYWVNATGDHPFWVEGAGWTRADALKEGDILRKADGSFGKAVGHNSIFRLPEWHNRPGVREGIGWVYDNDPDFIDHLDGVLYDYENGCQVPDSITYYLVDEMVEENYLEVTVYNIEVADFHTYYVGDAGIWVHNNDCMADH